jgi:dTDP-4-amino-4,6-dideoxygalactose transaminase
VPVLAEIVGQHDLGLDPDDLDNRATARTKAVCAVHYAGYPAAVESLRAWCAERSMALIEDAAHSPHLSPVGLASVYSFFSNKVLSCGEGGLLATNDDAVGEVARLLRSHAMTSGTWDRHLGHAATYDVVGTGYNYRLDEPRAALLSARLPRLQEDIAERRRLVHRYRAALADVPGITLPYDDDAVDRSACYVMPVMIDDPALRDPLRADLLERHGVQTSVLYPAIHEFTEYRGEQAQPLPRSEHAARTELTIPLFPHLSDASQDRVISGLIDGLDQLRG